MVAEVIAHIFYCSAWPLSCFVLAGLIELPPLRLQ